MSRHSESISAIVSAPARTLSEAEREACGRSHPPLSTFQASHSILLEQHRTENHREASVDLWNEAEGARSNPVNSCRYCRVSCVLRATSSSSCFLGVRKIWLKPHLPFWKRGSMLVSSTQQTLQCEAESCRSMTRLTFRLNLIRRICLNSKRLASKSQGHFKVVVVVPTEEAATAHWPRVKAAWIWSS